MPALPLLLVDLDGEPLAISAPRATLQDLAAALPAARLVWSEGDPDGPILGVWLDGPQRAYHRFADLHDAYGAASEPFFRGGMIEYRFIHSPAVLEDGAGSRTDAPCRECAIRAAGAHGICRRCDRVARLRAGSRRP